MSLALRLAVSDGEQGMPAISRPKPEISSLRDNGFGKPIQVQGHVHGNMMVSSGGVRETKEFSLISHIESLKETAYEDLYSPIGSLKTTHDLPYISRMLDTSALPTSTTSSIPSKWAIDPACVEGNLRKSANPSIKTCTIEDVVSRVSSCSKQSEMCEDDDGEEKSNKSRNRRKSSRGSKKSSGKTKDARNQPCHVSTNNLTPSITALKNGLNSNGLTVISALCHSIKIHQKTASNISVKTTPYQNKTLPKVFNGHRKSVSPLRASVSNAAIEYSKNRKLPPDRKKNDGTNEIVKSKVFLSDKQSGVISDGGLSFPCAPPATPTADQLRRTEYVPSLQDIRAQRVIRQRLQVLESKALKKEKKKLETDEKKEKMSLRERRIEKKKKQRQEIYELNRLMTECEHQRFVQFMSQVGSNI